MPQYKNYECLLVNERPLANISCMIRMGKNISTIYRSKMRPSGMKVGNMWTDIGKLRLDIIKLDKILSCIRTPMDPSKSYQNGSIHAVSAQHSLHEAHTATGRGCVLVHLWHSIGRHTFTRFILPDGSLEDIRDRIYPWGKIKIIMSKLYQNQQTCLRYSFLLITHLFHCFNKYFLE